MEVGFTTGRVAQSAMRERYRIIVDVYGVGRNPVIAIAPIGRPRVDKPAIAAPPCSYGPSVAQIIAAPHQIHRHRPRVWGRYGFGLNVYRTANGIRPINERRRALDELHLADRELVQLEAMIAPPWLALMLDAAIDHHHPVESEPPDKRLRLPRTDAYRLDTRKAFEAFHQATAQVAVHEILANHLHIERFLLLPAFHVVVNHQHFVEHAHPHLQYYRKFNSVPAYGNGCPPVCIADFTDHHPLVSRRHAGKRKYARRIGSRRPVSARPYVGAP